MGASGAKYGIATSHFYWVGAIPAMVFVGIFMMPFYYGSRARSVPEYLKLRFDEKTRGLQRDLVRDDDGVLLGHLDVRAGEAAAAAARLGLQRVALVSAGIVLVYIFLGGLTSAIYNEVLQFFLIVLGFVPLVFLGLRGRRRLGGPRREARRRSRPRGGFAPGACSQSWAHMGSPAANPMGVEWFGMVMGLGFVLSFGYWCTDFLVVQRAMAANSMSAARRTPLIAAVPKMLFPFLVILPGMIAIALTYANGSGFSLPKMADGSCDYTWSIPQMLGALLPAGHPRPRPHRADGVVHVRAWPATSPPSTRSGPTTSTRATSRRTRPTRTTCGWGGWRRSSASSSRWAPPTSRRSSTTSWTCCSSCSPS